ncbi:hypothetical protein WKW80_07945 [Variovorax humicola]|uniref:Secreted protein n=1 Tax=Variovorax humicola TaxID=1769758 RepID=A0ABU8VWK2_9BURK
MFTARLVEVVVVAIVIVAIVPACHAAGGHGRSLISNVEHRHARGVAHRHRSPDFWRYAIWPGGVI